MCVITKTKLCIKNKTLRKGLRVKTKMAATNSAEQTACYDDERQLDDVLALTRRLMQAQT